MPTAPVWVAPTWSVLREAGRAFSQRGARLLAAALAFYALLSVAPALVIALRVADLFTSEDVARQTLVHHLARWVGPSGATAIASMLERARESGAPTSVVSVVLLVYGSTRLFANLTRALDVLWGVTPNVDDTLPKKATGFLRRRALAFLFVLLVGALLVALVATHAVLVRVREVTGLGASFGERAEEMAVSFAAAVFVFGGVYHMLPSVKVPVRDAVTGGAITALLFTPGALLVSAYVARKASGSPFGGSTDVVMLLVWLHYSAHAFLYGAAVTAAVARRRGVLDASPRATP